VNKSHQTLFLWKTSMEIKKHSGIYTLKRSQLLPVHIDNAWAFFSNPINLNVITPDNLGFKITSDATDEIYQGQIITYKIRMFPFLKLNWVTEITFIEKKLYFIDEQRFGPYKMWHHEHMFVPKCDQTEVIDKVSFALPLGFLGNMAYKLFVKKKLVEIFRFRSKKIQEIFANN
jgi:ligand-binding SRPBCC domain-containing protein